MTECPHLKPESRVAHILEPPVGFRVGASVPPELTRGDTRNPPKGPREVRVVRVARGESYIANLGAFALGAEHSTRELQPCCVHELRKCNTGTLQSALQGPSAEVDSFCDPVDSDGAVGEATHDYLRQGASEVPRERQQRTGCTATTAAWHWRGQK